MLIKKERKIVVKEEKDVIKHEEKIVIKKEVDVIEHEEKVVIKEEAERIKQQEIKLEKGKDSFEFSREPATKNRKRSRTSTVNTANTVKKPKSYWTPEEDQALFEAVTSFVNGSWKEVCSRHPSLEERGTRMVHQRWNTKSKYFSGNGGK